MIIVSHLDDHTRHVSWLMAMCLGMLVLFSAPASAQKKLLEAPCIWLYKKQKLVQAARCFQEKAALLSAKQLHYKGRMLRNAALLWEQTAAKAASATAKQYRYLLAVQGFSAFVSKKMCLDPPICQQTAARLDTLCKTIGCATLRVGSSVADATVTLGAWRWRATHKGVRSYRLPPGKYSVGATAPKHKPTRMILTLAKNETRKVTIALASLVPNPRVVVPPRRGIPGRRAIPKRRIPMPQPPQKGGVSGVAVACWVVGGVLLVGGGVLSGVAFSTRQDYQQNTWNDPTKRATPEDAKQALQTPETLFYVGIAAAGTGAAAVIAGIIAQAAK